jgi:5-formyltetrahydrofolate cyclo-ligase
LDVQRAAAGYQPIRDELDPLPLLRALHETGYAIALPRTEEGFTLSFREWQPGCALERGKFGLSEPGEAQPRLFPAIVLTPLLAFDRQGNRLGYGAGYYDWALRDLRRRQPVVAIGIAFDEQEFPEIPREPQDEPLDLILTPSRAIPCER